MASAPTRQHVRAKDTRCLGHLPRLRSAVSPASIGMNRLAWALFCSGVVLAQSQSSTVLDCTPSSSHGLQPECWAYLDVSQYITDWLAANGTAAECETLGFAQCFLQWNGYGGRTCNKLTRGTCDQFDTAEAAASSISPQKFYTLWNIYAIYQFFNQFSEALSNGVGLAALNINDIVATLSPNTDSKSSNTLLLMAISGAFWLITVGPLGKAIEAFTTSIAIVLGMSDYFVPSFTGSANSRFILLGNIGNELANLVVEFRAGLEKTLQHLQDNSTLLMAAAAPGGFSTRAITSLDTDSVNIYHDLQLFVLSEALKANGIVSSRSTGVNAVDFAAKTRSAVSCPALGPASNCSQFWVDTTTNDTYALHNTRDWKWDNIAAAILDKILDRRWASPEEIFKVENCQGSNKPVFNGTRVLCLATHNFCEWDYAHQYVHEMRSEWNQWTNCKPDAKWGQLCSSWVTQYYVPAAYLGPLLEHEGKYCRKL